MRFSTSHSAAHVWNVMNGKEVTPQQWFHGGVRCGSEVISCSACSGTAKCTLIAAQQKQQLILIFKHGALRKIRCSKCNSQKKTQHDSAATAGPHEQEPRLWRHGCGHVPVRVQG
jgi:hypothetical protein